MHTNTFSATLEHMFDSQSRSPQDPPPNERLRTRSFSVGRDDQLNYEWFEFCRWDSLPVADKLAELPSREPDASVASDLALIDLGLLSSCDAITFLQVHERVASWWSSVQATALVRASGTETYVENVILFDDVLGFDAHGSITIVDAIREEVSSALRWSPATTQHRLDSARLLKGPLAQTQRSLSLGEITSGHAAVIIATVSRLKGGWPPVGRPDLTEAAAQDRVREIAVFHAACLELEARVLPVARKSTVARTRQSANRALIAISPTAAEQRRSNALIARDVYVIDEPDGISTLLSRMSTEQAHACLSVLNTHASDPRWMSGVGDRLAADPHTIADQGSARTGTTPGQRRVDVLAALILACDSGAGRAIGSSDTPPPTPGSVDAPTHSGPLAAKIRAHLDIVIDLATLIGLRDGSAELIGVGAITAEAARELLADATMRRLVSDPVTGHQLDYGRRVYAVPQRLRAFIASRDASCRFPGCGRRAKACQVDHAVAWSDGGQTDRNNLGALCTRHHQLKTHSGWDILSSDISGAAVWQSPQGRQYEHEPERVIPEAPPF